MAASRHLVNYTAGVATIATLQRLQTQVNIDKEITIYFQMAQNETFNYIDVKCNRNSPIYEINIYIFNSMKYNHNAPMTICQSIHFILCLPSVHRLCAFGVSDNKITNGLHSSETYLCINI